MDYLHNLFINSITCWGEKDSRKPSKFLPLKMRLLVHWKLDTVRCLSNNENFISHDIAKVTFFGIQYNNIFVQIQITIRRSTTYTYARNNVSSQRCLVSIMYRTMLITFRSYRDGSQVDTCRRPPNVSFYFLTKHCYKRKELICSQ